MAEFTYNPIQTILQNQAAIFNTSIGCPCGYVYHRNESGIIILKGSSNYSNRCYERYQCTFNGNIAVSEGGTLGPIAVALAISGEPIPTSRAMLATPEAIGDFNEVTSTALITVPRGCFFTVSLENVSEGTSIDLQNANLVVTRVA